MTPLPLPRRPSAHPDGRALPLCGAKHRMAGSLVDLARRPAGASLPLEEAIPGRVVVPFAGSLAEPLAFVAEGFPASRLVVAEAGPLSAAWMVCRRVAWGRQDDWKELEAAVETALAAGYDACRTWVSARYPLHPADVHLRDAAEVLVVAAGAMAGNLRWGRRRNGTWAINSPLGGSARGCKFDAAAIRRRMNLPRLRRIWTDLALCGFRCGTRWEAVVRKTWAGDLIVADPPWIREDGRAETRYLPAVWGPSDLSALLAELDAAVRRGVRFLLQHSPHSAIARWAAAGGHTIWQLCEPHRVGCNGAARGQRRVWIVEGGPEGRR